MSNKAYLYVIKLISSRDYSEHKLREKMREKKYPANEIDNVISEIKAKGYLKEELYAEARIKAFMNKGYSADYIRQKLAQEKVTVTEIEIYEIFDEYHLTENDQIERLLKKKLKTISEDKEKAYKDRQKAIRYAISKGHRPGTVFSMVKSKFTGIQIQEDEIY
jgi:regulatory protein